MKKEVLLVNPVFKESLHFLNIPMGLLAVGTYLLHHGYPVRILDMNNFHDEKEFHDAVAPGLDNTLCVGVSVMSSQIPGALSFSRFLKQRAPELPVIWGGVHPSLYPAQTVLSPVVDYVVIGEGEQSGLELINAIKNNSDVAGIPGIAYLDKGNHQPVVKRREGYLDMNLLPPVEWSLLSDIRRIGDMAGVEKFTEAGIPLQTSRGCPFRCTFCINSVLKEKYRYRDVDLVLDDLEGLIRAGVRRIYFRDELFFSYKKRLLQILDGIEKRRLSFSWYGSVRSDSFSKHILDIDLLKRLKENGCAVVGIGAESGSQRVLDMLDKQIKREDILEAARLLGQAGIKTHFSFMIGLPGEEKEDMRETLRVIQEIARVNHHFKILGPQVYRPYPGSTLYEKCIEAGMKEPSSLDEWAASAYSDPGINRKNRHLYPWVLYPIKYLQNIIFYTSMLGVTSRFPFLTRLIHGIVNWRCNRFFFRFPVEKGIYEVVRKSGVIGMLKEG